MVRRSAGLLMYRQRAQSLEVFLVHPGGPFWTKKEYECWSIPKGEYADNEDPFETAKREFQEETGWIPSGNFQELAEVKQAGGKRVKAWAFEGDADPTSIQSNTFVLEFPPKSGQMRTFPEVDLASWFSVAEAKDRIIKAQVSLLEELEHLLFNH